MKAFKLNMLTLGGTPRLRGQIYGETLRESIQEMLEYMKSIFLKKTGEEGDEMFREYVETTGYLSSTLEWAPHLVEETRGLAEGANLPFESIFGLQALEGLWAVTKTSEGSGCSALGIFDQPGGPTLLAQTADNDINWNDKLTLLHVIYPDSDLEIYTMTFAGLINVYGMNNRGVGVCINSLPELKANDRGVAVPFASRLILEKTNLEEVDQLMNSLQFITGENFLVGDQDEVVSYECSGNKISQYKPFAGATRIFHTNHAMTNDDRIDLESIPEKIRSKRSANTKTRLATLESHLKDPSKPVNVEDIKRVLSTRGEHPICVTGDNGSITNYGIIMELSENPVLHLSAGPPCKTHFWRFKF
jgi:isopenicillin-N N-acyltransferase-like protein